VVSCLASGRIRKRFASWPCARMLAGAKVPNEWCADIEATKRGKCKMWAVYALAIMGVAGRKSGPFGCLSLESASPLH
jgi:hypothetical protein